MVWTRHGHQIVNSPAEESRPPRVARCGGPGLCNDCSRDSAQWLNQRVKELQMADNLGVNPKKAFSSDDEGVDYPILARMLVTEHFNHTVNEAYGLKFEETYVVVFTYVMGNWKALVSTSRPDGRYYEVTSNKEKSEIYVDEYLKQDQSIWPTTG